MSTLDKIKKPIAFEMKTFDEKFKGYLSSKVPLVDRVMRYMVKRKGKQLRPILVFFSSILTVFLSFLTYLVSSLFLLILSSPLFLVFVVYFSSHRIVFFSLISLFHLKLSFLFLHFLLSMVLLLPVVSLLYELLYHVCVSF